MSSQPRIRRSVSVYRSRPSCIDGVGERFSSGIKELSMVRKTLEYTLSPINMPSLLAGAFAAGPVAIDASMIAVVGTCRGRYNLEIS